MNKLLILILTIAILTLAGCGEGGTTITKTDPFIGGTTGLSVNYAEGSPPSEVYDGGTYPFDVVVYLENKGEYTIPSDNVHVKLSGILPTSFSTTEANLEKSPEEDLIATEKDSEGDVLYGTPVYVTFEGLNYAESLEGNQVFPIRADVCYRYETRAVSSLCVLEDNLDTTQESVCKNNQAKQVWNSGAPVQVTTLKEAPTAEKKVRFTFTVTHSGNGDLYKNDLTNPCTTDNNIDENKVWVEVSTEIGSGLSCSGLTGGTDTTGYVRLYEGDINVMCTQEVTTSSDYETTINILLVYDYEEQKSADLLVKHQVS